MPPKHETTPISTGLEQSDANKSAEKKKRPVDNADHTLKAAIRDGACVDFLAGKLLAVTA